MAAPGVGLIPAYAGRTLLTELNRPLAEAHPRLRGADVSSMREPDFDKGSSPLTRGGLTSIIKNLRLIRLIPAYAGRTREERDNT